MCFLPAYSPELQPAERLWPLTNEIIANQTPQSLDELEELLILRCQKLLLANSDCVALLPNRMAQQCAKAMNLKLLPPPIAIEGFTVSMVWHQRNTNNSQHQWLRQQIVNAVRNI